MSDETASVDPVAGGPTTEVQNPPVAKAPRSPVERTIVWGAIGILLIVAAVQGIALFGFKHSSADVIAAMKRAEAGTSGEVLNLEAAEKLMTGFWTKSELKKEDSGSTWYVVYKWPGVYASYRLLLNTGADEKSPQIISYELNAETSHHDKDRADLMEKTGKALREKGARLREEAENPDNAGDPEE